MHSSGILTLVTKVSRQSVTIKWKKRLFQEYVEQFFRNGGWCFRSALHTFSSKNLASHGRPRHCHGWSSAHAGMFWLLWHGQHSFPSKAQPSQATTQTTWRDSSPGTPQGGHHVAPPSPVHVLEEEQSLWSPRGDSHQAHLTQFCAWHDLITSSLGSKCTSSRAKCNSPLICWKAWHLNVS